MTYEHQLNLGAAATFGVLAATAVTNTGASTITGDLGEAPGTTFTGFPPGTFTGTQHSNDATSIAAQTALANAIAAAQGLAGAVTIPGDIGGMTLIPGLYDRASSLAITGTVTLDGQGDPNATWIIRAGSTLIPATSSVVLLINGAKAENVFWIVGSSATISTSAVFVGQVLAHTSITANTSATINGRLLANIGAVTLDTNTITFTNIPFVPLVYRSPSITNLDALVPQANTDFDGAPGRIDYLDDFITPAAADGAGTKYFILRVKSTIVVKQVVLESEAQGAGKVQVGVYYADDARYLGGGSQNPLAGTVIDVKFFSDDVDLAAAVTSKNVTFNGTAPSYSIGKRAMPLWQALGLTKDPGGMFDIVLTVHTTDITTGTGKVLLSMEFIDP